MSNQDLTVFEQGGVPDYIKKDFVGPAETVDELSAGVTTGFPVLSFRGKVWRLKKSGEERALVDENNDPRPSFEVVIVRGSSRISKVYYEGGYEEGASEAPTCFSMDGTRPDPAAKEQQAQLCATCPHNQWGSKITPQGTKTKRCSDTRRLAVVSANDLANNYADATPLLLRIPGASLQGLKEYAERTLGQRGYHYYSVATRLGFDTTTSYPKLVYRPTRPLMQQEYEAVKKLRESDEVARVLSDHGDLLHGETEGEDGPIVNTEAESAAQAPEWQEPAPPQAAPQPAPQPAPAPAKAAAKGKATTKNAAPAETNEAPPPSSRLDAVKSDVDALLGSL